MTALGEAGDSFGLEAAGLGSARAKAEKLGLNGGTRTILMCVDRKTAKCAGSKQMMQSWKYLKRRLKELKLNGRGEVLRVRMGCVGICKGGPIVAVMPDGTWYGGCTPEVIERILQEHVMRGVVVEEFVIAQSVTGG